jgi:uncharacterized protein (TIGR03118 family)
MKKDFLKASISFLPQVIFIILFILTVNISCRKAINEPVAEEMQVTKSPKDLKDFEQVNLVGNNTEYNPVRVDPLLVNAWGIAFSPTGTIWVSAEGTGVSTVYNKEGAQVLAPVAIPSPSATTGGHPTGQVFNGSRGFRLSNGNPARFIFAGADGVISGWNGGTLAREAVDESPDAVYLGITMARDGADSFLYVANFSQNRIDVYDSAWHEVSKPFMDPNIPAGYAPFNIENIGNKLYVMYAKVGDGEEETGPGLGYVDEYNTNGTLIRRFVSRGQLNAPWGIAKTPATFWGEDGMTNIYLIGNFGDGRINAFNENGQFLGQLRSHGNPIVIEGLWGISFPPVTATAIDPNRLYFAAGPDDEEEGLFGYIIKQ